MNIRPIAPCFALLSVLAFQPAAASGTSDLGTLLGSRLAGLWATDIYVSPAACTPGAPRPPLLGRNTMVINSGGTAVENPQVIPSGVPGAPQIRTFGLGKWSFEPRTGKYKLHLRFDWYASSDGTYLGHQVIDRTILLSNDRNRAFGPVTAVRYAPDGSIVTRACGEAVSTRL